MKNIIKHTILIAGVALMATACQKELSLSDKEGSVSFNIQMEPITRAGENDTTGETDFVPDNVKVRIYRPARPGETGEQLIRRYLSIADIPNPLYLIAGNYSVKVDGGDTSNTAFKEPGTDAERQKKLCYYGTQGFGIEAKKNSGITVECKTINTKVNVGFDINDSEKDRANDSGYTDDGKPSKYENRKLKDVKITIAAITTSATAVDAFEDDVTAQKAPKLVFAGSEFTETKTVNSGYFLVPDGVTTLVWAFEGTHEDDGAVAQLGTINMVANVRGYAHTVNFNYSRTPDGFAGITVKVDDAVEICEDSFYFKAQPQITGQMVENGESTGLDIEGDNIFKQGNSLSLTCEGINDLTDISLGGVEFFNNGEVVDNAIVGLTANKESATKVTFTISQNYFNTLNGSTQELRFVMTDTEEDPCEQVLKIRKRGIMAGEGEQTYDLWNNTATIQAFVPEATDNSTVKIKCKRADATAYIAMTTPTKSTDSQVWTATTTASWPQATTNRNSKTIYIPDSSLGIYANNAYTYELWVDEEKVDEYILTPTVSQIIIDADFEKSDLYCYGQPANDIPDGQIWGSGNNGFTEDDPLCRYGGSGTNHYAHLSSCVAGALGVEMLAAGNLFTGDFIRPGTRGTVSFGIKYQWQARPTALKFKYWGDIGTVDRTDKSTIHITEGQPDQASVYVAIVAWDTQRPVTSGTGDPDGMWSPEGGADATANQGKIIGYGVAYPTGKTNNDGNLVEYEVPIVYYDTTTNPSNSNYSLVISFATSRYGDYMNGCSDSNMYIDDVEWSYSSTFSNRFPYDTTQTPQ